MMVLSSAIKLYQILPPAHSVCTAKGFESLCICRESNFDYVMRLAAVFERPDWVGLTGTATSVYASSLTTYIIAFEKNIPWEEAEKKFNQSAIGQVLKNSSGT